MMHPERCHVEHVNVNDGPVRLPQPAAASAWSQCAAVPSLLLLARILSACLMQHTGRWLSKEETHTVHAHPLHWQQQLRSPRGRCAAAECLTAHPSSARGGSVQLRPASSRACTPARAPGCRPRPPPHGRAARRAAGAACARAATPRAWHGPRAGPGAQGRTGSWSPHLSEGCRPPSSTAQLRSWWACACPPPTPCHPPLLSCA
mmetsp:Transcript_28274/g.72099  ORF Transcript_28274/g.72099 Transcript_28274/m.72099 type:complete len:204 (+) Transcript_28274:297-908(+)